MVVLTLRRSCRSRLSLALGQRPCWLMAQAANVVGKIRRESSLRSAAVCPLVDRGWVPGVLGRKAGAVKGLAEKHRRSQRLSMQSRNRLITGRYIGNVLQIFGARRWRTILMPQHALIWESQATRLLKQERLVEHWFPWCRYMPSPPTPLMLCRPQNNSTETRRNAELTGPNMQMSYSLWCRMARLVRFQ